MEDTVAKTIEEIYVSIKEVDIKSLEERLSSRFLAGLLADIQPPEIETRIAIIKKKAQLLDMEMPDDVVKFIAEKLKKFEIN